MEAKQLINETRLAAVITIFAGILLICFNITYNTAINGYNPKYDTEHKIINSSINGTEKSDSWIASMSALDVLLSYAQNVGKLCKFTSIYNNVKPMYFNEYQYNKNEYKYNMKRKTLLKQFEININELRNIALQFISNTELLTSYQSRNECIVYIKQNVTFQSYVIKLSKKYQCRLFKYGQYKKDDFLRTAKQAKFAIISDEWQSQRYEYIQLMAYNVPLFIMLNNKYSSISHNFDNSLCGHICVVDEENLNKTDNCFNNIFLSNINKGIYKPSIYALKQFNKCSYIETWFNFTLPLILENVSNELKTPYIPFYIFQVGFSKSGASTLYYFFTANDIPSIHWKHYYESNIGTQHLNISLNEYMNTMHKMNKSVLTHLDKKYMSYSDYGSGFKQWYKILNKQYPNSKYILSIRNINHWLRSRYMHNEHGTFPMIETQKTNKMRMYGINYNSLNQTIETKIEYEILMEWKRRWYKYHCNILQYFKSHYLSNNLLIFDIEYDSVDKLIKFFEHFNLKLNKTLYNKIGNTKERANRDIATQKQLKKWENMHSMFVKQTDNFTNEYQRIMFFCTNNYHQNQL